MSDPVAPKLRERVWITMIDHEQEPPQPIREVFFENGELRTVIDLTTTSAAPRPVDASTPAA